MVDEYEAEAEAAAVSDTSFSVPVVSILFTTSELRTIISFSKGLFHCVFVHFARERSECL